MKDEGTVRFSVSLPAELVRELDAMVAEKGSDSRSRAIGDMIRRSLVEHRELTRPGEIVATVDLVYDHRKRQLHSHLVEHAHDHADLILSTMHIHLDHHRCLEVVVVRGERTAVRHLADTMMGAPGVLFGHLTVTRSESEASA